MNLYVIRHGETNMGKNKSIATEKETLNDNGIQQAICSSWWSTKSNSLVL